jgi:LDH2 family malate/lactate/ureidoglycolate dehydrogenase
MGIKLTDLKQKLIKLAEQAVDAEAAEYYANEVIEAHIRKSPRTNVLKSAIGDVEKSIQLKDTKISYDIDLPSYLSINFHGHGPLTYIKQIHDELETRSNKNGLAMAAFTNGQSMHTLHTWVQGLAKRGLLAMAVCNGGPRSVVPFNGTKGLFGTNPMAYGFPGNNKEIFCVDMATSEIPYFEILDAEKNNKPLRDRSAVDSRGEFTNNAREALDFSISKSDPTSNIVPVGGGYKGYYLVYLMEVLTSALIGAPSSPEMSLSYVPEEHGSILLAFSPKAFGTKKGFDKSVETLNTAIKSQKSKRGTKIVLPGESNNSKFSNLPQEIDVDEKLLEKLS